MTVSTDNTVEASLSQEKPDVNTQQPQVDASSQQKPAENKPSEEDPNWRAFREARKQDRAKTEAAEKRAAEKEAEAEALKAAMEAAFSRESKSVHHRADMENREYASEETEDERIEKKVLAALAAREQAADRARAQREQQEYPQRLNQTYQDFNQTVSSENLDYLEYHYPEVANPLKRLQDGYDKWADIYKAVKKFVPNSVSAKKEAARADANFNKPKSMSATNMTQPGETAGGNKLTEDRKAENWARMKKMLGTVG